ncbi:Leu/Phe/Val dehydrogenase [Ornithinibacillus xuwenensis]|uniref:Glu/Leu/Phe/Val dehydrogenase n=1 Tax=Ornithinibacillus xuwenensis TaxID=3144668 RepID=A0ABU9XFS8_9BACI
MEFVEGLSKNTNFELLDKMSEHEQVVFCNDVHSGLQAIIAIHSTKLGPALGGCRMYPYMSLDEALDDVLRLSKGMTYKCAAADVDFGGGKAVIIGNPETDKSPAMFRAFGQFVESLNGRFYTGTDMGTTMDDFIHAKRETNNIVGIPEAYGGGGDSSIPTSQGVIYAIMATNKMLFGSDQLQGVSYAIQGLGKVGYKVAEHLMIHGAEIVVSDFNQERIDKLKEKAKLTTGSLKVVQSDAIYDQDVDVFVPCAVGGIINDQTIERLQVRGIVGSANNQLQSDEHAQKLFEKGILYAPDYIANSGGLIQVADELYGFSKERVLAKTKEIYHVMLQVYHEAEKRQISTSDAANHLCEKIMSEKGVRNSFFTRSVRPKWNVK